MRVVFDTNIVVSMSLAKQGTMQRLRKAWRDGQFGVLSSDKLIQEVKKVLEYPRLASLLTPELKRTVLSELDTLAEATVLREPFPTFEVAEDDRFLLAMVRDGKADCLITGDKKLLELGYVDGIPVLTATTFLVWLEETKNNL
jgi:uncharacterized protein